MKLQNTDVIKFECKGRFGHLFDDQKVTLVFSEFLEKAFPGIDQEYFTGHECSVLAEGKPWQSGKFVISVEFIPDTEDELQQLEKEIEGTR